VFGAQSGHVPDDPDLNAKFLGELWAHDNRPDWEVKEGLTERDLGHPTVWPDSNGSAHAWRKAGVTVDQESGDRPARQRAPRRPSRSAALTAEPARLSARLSRRRDPSN